MRPLVDGRDVLAEIHPDGVSSCSARDWVRPPGEWPLSAPEEPREVELSHNNCHTGCCGGVFVTIRREGDRVVWSSLRNTSETRVPVPAEVRFDAAEYDAELARAAADTAWEEPVDTVARLTATELTDSGWFEPTTPARPPTGGEAEPPLRRPSGGSGPGPSPHPPGRP
ncbi:hypothetical protein ABT034_13140 [Streptomyces sp. NPDC002773]|uniref:hypothetical protein n=1 Tax=Streptomyces sp. NPDC002773 TaxID=3154430 RepID=UPI00331D06AF